MNRTDGVGATLLVFGFVAIAAAAEPLSYGIVRHWNMADSLFAYLGTLGTYATEIFVETDFIGIERTVVAWLGLVIAQIGSGFLLWNGFETLDLDELQEEDHGTA